MSNSRRDKTPEKRNFSSNKKSTFKSSKEKPSKNRKDGKSYSGEEKGFGRNKSFQSNNRFGKKNLEEKGSSEISRKKSGSDGGKFGKDNSTAKSKSAFNKRRSRNSDDKTVFSKKGVSKNSGKKEEFKGKKIGKTPFSPFSKSKPSESSRRSAFKKLEKDFSKFPEPPSYNIKEPKGSKKSNEKKEAGGKIRLNKFISNSGVCSRRDADILIQAGEISVNGTIVTELGLKVDKNDVIKYQGQTLKAEKPVYVLLNKPKDFITTMDDPEERKTVMSLVKTACKERIYPVGRLDRQTTGLLLLTNDGELAKKLTHPSHNVKKIYQVDLDRPIAKEDFEKILNGFDLEDGPVNVDSLAVVASDKRSLGIEIHEGRNRIVRRIFEFLGYEVVKLDRVMYAGLTKKDLPRGKWRYLSEKEVIRLKYFL